MNDDDDDDDDDGGGGGGARRTGGDGAEPVAVHEPGDGHLVRGLRHRADEGGSAARDVRRRIARATVRDDDAGARARDLARARKTTECIRSI